MDIFLIAITLGGVCLITIGYSDVFYELKSTDQYNIPTVPPLWSVLVLITIPFLRALNLILTRKMKGLHDNTVACYMNPFLAVTMFIGMKLRGFTLDFFLDGHMTFVDWLLFIFISAFLVVG
jgi:drug/metabolite transporter (DMT)-like permease